MISHEAFLKVVEYFKGDREAAFKWFYMPNSYLGGIKPIEMALKGRSNKLIKLIDRLEKGYSI